jgi:hypothetical protein
MTSRRPSPSGAFLRISLLVAVVGLAGCPDNPYKASSWTKKLGSREHDRAVQELEQLGDPSAIPDLGEAWLNGGRPLRDLQAIIAIARPLSAKEAREKFVVDYEETGREASWEKALPFLEKALVDVDEASTKSVEAASKAAEAMGESQLAKGLDALVAVAVDKPVSKKLFSAQIASIRAMGKFSSDKARASAALIKIIDRDPPPHPKTVKGKDETETKELKRAAEEKYTMFLASTGAAVNALGELQIENASATLILSLYRTPELASQLRRALVASGPKAKEELRRVLRGENKEVEALFARKSAIFPQGLGFYCGDRGELPADKCAQVSFRDFYAALVLGDFYDMASTPELLAALKRPAAPAFFVDDQPGPTQHATIFDALRKIGAPQAAATVRDLWMTSKGGADLQTRILAINAYPFVTRDNVGAEELGKIAADNLADDGLRQAAATAFARLARNAGDVKVLEGLAQKYMDASDKKRKEADGEPKKKADAADKVFAADKKKVDEAKANVLRTTRDPSKGAPEIRAATAAAKAAEDAFKIAKGKHNDATQSYKSADRAAKTYKGFARMFQTHIARIEIAIRCKDDPKCYAASLSLEPATSAKNLERYIRDLKQWTDDEKLGLLEGNVERAMLEIGKKGTAVGNLQVSGPDGKQMTMTELLLEKVTSENRLVRQSILLALPKIANVPCDACEKKLQLAIKAGEGKTTLTDLNLETTMLRHYFGWAGGKTPNTKLEDDAIPTPAPAPTKK